MGGRGQTNKIILRRIYMATNVEARLEANFVKWCKEKGILAIKGPVGTSKGFPDRFLQLPNMGGTVYVEFKGSSYYGLTPLQEWWKEYILSSSPNRYFVVDNDLDLVRLKRRCEHFISIGVTLHAYETQLLERLELDDLHKQ
jgi:hypothetical protein